MADKTLAEQDAAVRAAQEAVRAELSDIETRLDAGTATPSDIARAVKLVMKSTGLAKTP